MSLWVTKLQAIDPKTGELVSWVGPHVPGASLKLAQEYCDNNGMGYCTVVGRLLGERPYDPNNSTDVQDPLMN